MRFEKKHVYKTYRAGGKRFCVYWEYDEQLGESHPIYPDFETHPEYTDSGRPFATAGQESCPHCKPKAKGEPPPYDCGGCGWFHRESTPYDPIGVCMCDVLRNVQK